MPEVLDVVGLPPGGTAALAGAPRDALEAADLVVAGRRHLAALKGALALREGAPRRLLALGGDLGGPLDAIAAETGRVCVLASGDPGFFGVVRPLAERFGARALTVHPAPSSVALAFARLGIPWDDAAVVSAHGRPLSAAAAAAAGQAKVAVLASPTAPPEVLGAALLAAGARHRRAAVCAELGTPNESVTLTDLTGLAARRWPALAVVVLTDGDDVAPAATLARNPDLVPAAALARRPDAAAPPQSGQPACLGLEDDELEHRGTMITKSEVRAAVLGRLLLPEQGVMWDVGAGCGSIAVECSRLRPRLRVVAVEAEGEQARRVAVNAARLGARVEVVHGRAPEVLAGLADPDRVFVGGGGTAVLEAAADRLPPGGRLVATFAALDRALAARARLGSLIQISVSRAVDLPDGGVRLAAENPVFLAWGPSGRRT